MFDKNGAEILSKQLLYSHTHGKVGPEMRCFGYRETDGKIILGQDRVGEQPIYLTQEQLLTTHVWVIDSKFETEQEGAFTTCSEILDDWFNGANIQGVAKMETVELIDIIECMKGIEERR